MNRSKKKLWRIIAALCAVVVIALPAALPLLTESAKTEAGPTASILHGSVTEGTIQTTLFGGGTLTEQDAVTVSVPSAVKLTGWLVENGAAVAAGDGLATVDRVSVREAIASVQETLDHLAQQLSEESTASTATVTARASGTVKLVYAGAGDRVEDVMLRHGALAVLSLDGLMAVSLEAPSELAVGSTVPVTLSDGTTAEGRVESNLAGTLVVTLEDKGYAPGDTVEVAGVGSGQLAIHSPWNATAYTGTVSAVRISTEKAVSTGQTLFTLEATGITAAWQQLADQRRAYEQLQLELFTLYQTATLAAPCDGIVSGIDYTAQQLSGGRSFLLANAPNGDDDTLYSNFWGKVTAVGNNGWALAMDPESLPIADYSLLETLTPEESRLTELVIYDPTSGGSAPVPVYEMGETGWQAVDTSTVSAGDMLLFAADDTGSFVWIVRVAKQEAPSGGTGTPSGNRPGSGITGGFATQEEEVEFTLYDRSAVTLLSITPQSTVTVEITVDEQDILQLQPGQSARVTVDALGGESFDAQITAIGNIGSNNGGSSKYTVTLTLARSSQMLGGMTATAAISLGSTDAVPTIPVAALEEVGTQTVVYTGQDEKTGALTDPVVVQTGASDGESVELLSGLHAGDTFYYAYYDTLVISELPDFGWSGSPGRR